MHPLPTGREHDRLGSSGRIRSTLVASACLLCALPAFFAIPACQTVRVPQGAWPFRPTNLQVHPLTRFVDDEERESGRLLALRLQFTDRWGDPSKFVGTIDITIEGVELNRATVEYQLDLRELEANRLHWDDVTQTYLARLQIPQSPSAGTRVPVRVDARADDGARFRRDVELGWNERSVTPLHD